MGVEEAFRKSLFQVISLQTSTGFATADYMLWPSILWGCLIVVMLIGACAGSTTGGIKCIRMVILFKVAKNEFKHILHPNAVLPVRVNKQVISPSIQSTVLAFTFLYAVIAIISILIMLGFGVGFLESIGTVCFKVWVIWDRASVPVARPIRGVSYPTLQNGYFLSLCSSDVWNYLRYYCSSVPISGKRTKRVLT